MSSSNLVVKSRKPAAKVVAEHPFLIVRKADYAKLQARALQSPWREQKEAALFDAETVRYCATARIDIKAITLAKILSTTALAYILDPAGRPRYAERIVQHLRPFDPAEPGSIVAEMRANPDKTVWRHAVPTGNAFFQGVLALDIIRDDLSAAELADIEDMLRDGPAAYFRDTRLAWKQGTLAAAAIWPLYKRDAATYGPIIEQWKHDTLNAISADGVFIGGAAYADARWSFADRENKAAFGEVLAHTGVLPDWYAEPKLASFMEWLNGYAYTPFRVLWSFGDSGPDRFNGHHQPGSERAYRYSPLAGRYAAWLRDGMTPPGALASYVLADQPPAEPLAAPSRVFADGGAWLKEQSFDRKSLSAAMWNLAAEGDAHSHKETNSICIAGYGEMLLRAGGYNGWATPEQGFSWDYIHDRAIAGNVVLFDYAVPTSTAEERLPPAVNDHVHKHGRGITASLLSGVIDFARGDSGEAIPNGHHVRNFIFVHPADGVGGYYATLDELSAAAGSTAHVVWHPSSAHCSVTTENHEYTWTTNEFGGHDVGLTIVMATPPRDVNLRDGMLANWGHGVIGKYAVGNYVLDETGTGRVLTVLFPHDAEHAKAGFDVSDDTDAKSVSVRQGDVRDIVFISDGRAEVTPCDAVRTSARAGLARETADGGCAMVWLMDATRLTLGDLQITSTVPVTMVYQRNTCWVSATSAARLTVRAERSFRVERDGRTSDLTRDPLSDTVVLEVPSGTTALHMLSNI